MKRGELWWARLPAPAGSEAGYRRPVLIAQADWLNRSALHTVLVVPLTSNADRAAAAGNVLLRPEVTGLSKTSVALVALLAALDRAFLETRIGVLPEALMARVDAGLRKVLALERA